MLLLGLPQWSLVHSTGVHGQHAAQAHPTHLCLHYIGPSHTQQQFSASSPCSHQPLTPSLCSAPPRRATNVVGMITRKDLLPEVLEQKFASSPYAMVGEASPFTGLPGSGAQQGGEGSRLDEEDGSAGQGSSSIQRRPGANKLMNGGAGAAQDGGKAGPSGAGRLVLGAK
jgi:hypothetical protein